MLAMGKEFKDYDKLYAGSRHSFMPYERELYDTTKVEVLAALSDVWLATRPLGKWSVSEIAYAVYESTGAGAWQQFRVSLKGFSTKVKLFRLEKRYDYGRINFSLAEQALERIRIDNYIGALVRGGQLHPQSLIVLK